MNNVKIAVTGLSWMKLGIRSIWSIIEDIITNAKDEIQIAIYMITNNAIDFITLLSNALHRGIKITIILNSFQFQNEKVKKILLDLAKNFNNFYLFDFENVNGGSLHAKIIVIDRTVAFIGSSNLTWSGLTSNHEIGLLIEGPVASQISNLIDVLSQGKNIVRIGYSNE